LLKIGAAQKKLKVLEFVPKKIGGRSGILDD
jgi:hypothetical protein